MAELIKNLPEIIKQAAQNPLGIVALMIVAFTILAYVFFGRRKGKKDFRLLIFILLFVGCLLFAVVVMRNTRPPSPLPPTPSIIEIKITIIPPAGPGGPNSSGDIAGRIEGLGDSLGYTNYAVVVYAKTTSWYVQPETDRPLTEIGRNGEWSNKIHLGSRYAVILVKKPFSPPNQFEIPNIPQMDGFLTMTNFEGIR
jgi:energy-coupling factor transporter transmembrane protein EcfT